MNIDELDDALKYIKENKCILFIGSGVSALAGCSDWRKLVKDMLANPIISSTIRPEELSEQISNETKLEYCKNQFEKNNAVKAYWGAVRNALLVNDQEKYETEYLSFIRNLKTISPFPKVIMTTNIDSLLEQSRMFNNENIFHKITDFSLSINPEGIFHIHGYFEDLENALFVKSQYVPKYSDPAFIDFLKSVAQSNSFVFLGSRVEESFRDNVLLTTKRSGIYHYLLVHDDYKLSDSEITLYLDLYNIKVIKYGPMDRFKTNMESWINSRFPRTEAKSPRTEDTYEIQ